MTTPTLTREDVHAMRGADRVCFYGNPQKAYIRAIKENRTGPFRGEVEREIVAAVETEFYLNKNGDGVTAENWRGFDMIHCAQLAPDWLTLAAMVKPGDAIALRWRKDAGSTDRLAEQGLHGDALQFVIIRGKRRLVFNLLAGTCTNDTARMIQRARPSDRYSLVATG